MHENNQYYKSIDGNLYSKNGNTFVGYAAGKNNPDFVIQSSVTEIGNYAFNCCTSLMSVTIPDSVTSIGDLAFRGCANLTSVTIPDSVTSIGDFVFEKCTSLTSINVHENNQFYKSIDGNLFSKDEKELIRFAAKNINHDFTISDSVKVIAKGAFEGCTNLTSVTIPDSVTAIGYYAFEGCTSLTIYCEREMLGAPYSQDLSWNPSGCPIVWEYVKE